MAIQMQRLRVCKYALKFGDLSVENTWEAFKVLKGKQQAVHLARYGE